MTECKGYVVMMRHHIYEKHKSSFQLEVISNKNQAIVAVLSRMIAILSKQVIFHSLLN